VLEQKIEIGLPVNAGTVHEMEKLLESHHGAVASVWLIPLRSVLSGDLSIGLNWPRSSPACPVGPVASLRSICGMSRTANQNKKFGIFGPECLFGGRRVGSMILEEIRDQPAQPVIARIAVKAFVRALLEDMYDASSEIQLRNSLIWGFAPHSQNPFDANGS
jgi:hypothetical protein